MTMRDVVTVPVVGPPTDHQINLIYEAKQVLNVDYLMRLTSGKPGDQGTYLAFEHPKWFPPNGYAYVKTVDNVQRMRAAVAQVLGEEEPTRLTTPERWLARILATTVDKVNDYET